MIQLNLTKTPSQLFSKNLVRIKYIQYIQLDLEKCETHRRDLKIRYLNQSYVFQLVAYWQVFIEELAKFGFEQIGESEESEYLLSLARSRLDDLLKKFNTPNKENIDKLFKDGLGISQISASWKDDELSYAKATSTLAELLNSRHQIAHTGNTSSSLSYEINFERMKILMKMAELTELTMMKRLPIKGEPNGVDAD